MMEKYNLPPTEVTIANFRLANKSYEVGDVVEVLYHANLHMECTKAGTTCGEALDTTGVTAGDILEDGDVTWLVVPVGMSYIVWGEVTERDESKPTYGLE